ncbi:uncharacterized protein LOC133925382 [Phragmites australis]|uniref:uncharacterized protein LOC133925382 n=1 Tax=Phragmites australis TaxID=29695 RepID=UPI002D785776|nr:uncharacterized protein LOC133925382 [Phragmites australis]
MEKETLHKFIRCFNNIQSTIPKVTDADVIQAFTRGCRNHRCIEDLAINDPKTVKELMDIADKAASVEESLSFNKDSIDFLTANKVVEYEGLLAGLRVVSALAIHYLLMNGDSQLVVKQDSENIDDAAKQILDLLRAAHGSQENKTKSFLFHGWEGLGASSVLKAIAEFLKSTSCDSDTRNLFGKIIHVDCTLWKSRRAMQRTIAEELGLHHLMPRFHKMDEDDDFRGVDDGSRVEIASIGTAIFQSLVNERFLVIFHCGTDEDINFDDFGIPSKFSYGEVLWTKYGRFQLTREDDFSSTSINIVGNIKRILYLWHQEVVELIRCMGMMSINTDLVLDCYSYLLFLICQDSTRTVDFDWLTHACNYWICDGILRGDRAWEIGKALHKLILTPLGYSSDLVQYLEGFLGEEIERRREWVSITIKQHGEQRSLTSPVKASSYFLTFVGNGQLELQTDLFQPASNLHVLKLCKCSFDFSSPPFRYCQNLRFLWLDHCTNNAKDPEQNAVSCFPNLWVLDLRFTNYINFSHMLELMNNLRELNTMGVSWRTISHAWKRLQDLQKLRLTKTSEVITVDSCSSIDLMNLELLDLSSNTQMESLPDLSLAEKLKMLVLDGCSGLAHVTLERAPMLEIFSLDGYGPATNWTHSLQLPKRELRPKSHVSQDEAKLSKVSLKGCARLHSVFLHALPKLEELDMSGTAIKTLDLGAMDAPRLKKLFLLGCEQLRSLLWDGNNPELQVLHVDTQGRSTRSAVCCGELRFEDFEADITFKDGRFLWSAMQGLYRRMNYSSSVHLHICSSTIHSQAIIAKSIVEICQSHEDLVTIWSFLPYRDIVLTKDVASSALSWDRLQLKRLKRHVEIGEGSCHLESMRDSEHYHQFVQFYIESLHVHDNSSIKAIPPSPLGDFCTSWSNFKWCHVERCPKLHTLFTWPTGTEIRVAFLHLVTFSASDLQMAHCIWDKGINAQTWEGYYFVNLKHIYLSNCPRLKFVLPISFDLPSLEILHIEYCSNVTHVFPLDHEYPKRIAARAEFKNLKHIKLQHLHNLEQISEARVLSAPALETISLRDCWGLRRLPAIAVRDPKPVVDCEKDWWDKLEWDGRDAGHDPSLFKTRHSDYYKKTIRRVSVLR